jgi:cyclopropane-fatty-acyl-phospholipid synthase
VAIYDGDYLDDSGHSIEEKLHRHLERAGCGTPPGRVVVVTSARYFHRVFNPVSFYYIFDEEGELRCNVAEVNNTFGERHLYILKEPLTPTGHYPVRYRAPKGFHVSPFNNMEGTYEFHFGDLSKGLDISVRLHRGMERVFEAQLTGHSVPLTPSSHLRVLLRHPLMPHLTLPRILWQAAHLYFQRRLPVNTKPIPMSLMTIKRNPPSILERRCQDIVSHLLSRMREGALHVQMPDGGSHVFGDQRLLPGAAITVHDYGFFRRLAFGGEVGLGESYMAGEWESPAVADVLKVLITNQDAIRNGSMLLTLATRTLDNLRHFARENSLFGSRRNIREHYDLSNDFFRLFLDDSMTYSCAIFRSETENLEQAQRNKLRAMITKARIGADDHVLEIGCGWGSFALEAVRETGCRVTGITISKEQHALARRRVTEAGLQDRITLLLRDYRHVEGRFDRIVSIEMLEAVGHEYFGDFFRCCDRLLKPQGLAVLQTITVPDHRYDQYRKGCDWIQKHIFPGGHLPSLGALCGAMAENSRFVVEHLENIGIHYAQTLREWRLRFIRNVDEVAALRFDRTFQRKWLYYLSFCEAAFATRSLGVLQLVLTRPNNRSLNGSV